MKYLVVLCVVMFVAFANGQGIPTKPCPPGEHSVLYCPRKAEPDCTNPTVHDFGRPAACGIPDCFCNQPTVRNKLTGKCVELTKCP